ncbi:hypothetical protein [Actinoplanes sp. URMC 104]|uniref:hypothetical protein n=1 Tax=Actinoplanes sp. URMC 104 TaxID=3423409 RepID=UPI003F1B12C3
MLFQQAQITANCFGRDVELRREFRDLDLSVPAGQRDDLMLPLVRIQFAATSPSSTDLFVTPEKPVVLITRSATSLFTCPFARSRTSTKITSKPDRSRESSDRLLGNRDHIMTGHVSSGFRFVRTPAFPAPAAAFLKCGRRGPTGNVCKRRIN